MMGGSTLVVVADDTMETLNRIVSVLRARRYRIVTLTLVPGDWPGLATLTIGLDPTTGAAAPAQRYLERIEEVKQVRIATPLAGDGLPAS
jgi:acetolactate synthase small subunit